MMIAAFWQTFAGVAGPAAVSALWQGAALALALALCLRLTARISAADRFKVWAAGFAALIVLPFLPALFSSIHALFASSPATLSDPIGQSTQPDALQPHPWLNLDPRWLLAIAAAWLAGSLLRAADLAVHTARLRRLWKRAAPLNTASRRFVCDLAQVCTTRDLDRPSVIGFFAPRILIPDWLLERLSDSELEQVVLHEAEHLRRRDDWTNLAQKLCLMVFPLNPALVWMDRRLCREREMACDEGVVRRTKAPRAYAACLASLAARRFERKNGLERRVAALSLGAWQRRPELVERVHRILRRSPGLHPAAARALVGVVGCGLIFGSVELARCPHLVAFAAPPAVAQPVANPTLAADAMVDGAPMSGFRAIDMVAHVPSRAELAQARKSQQRIAMNRVRARRRPSLAAAGIRQNPAQSPAESMVAFDSREPAASRAQLEPQQWIVLTTWEQVESTSSTANQADESDRTADSAPQNSAPQVVRRFTMTQLILRVGPVGMAGSAPQAPAAASAIKTAPASKTISITPLPAAVPIRDGWLVIQL